MGFVLLAVISLVRPGIAKLAVAVFGDPIVEIAICSLMRVRDKNEVRGCCPWGRLDFLRRHRDDIEPRSFAHVDRTYVLKRRARLPCVRVRAYSVKSAVIA